MSDFDCAAKTGDLETVRQLAPTAGEEDLTLVLFEARGSSSTEWSTMRARGAGAWTADSYLRSNV